jgi:hypothetical protein
LMPPSPLISGSSTCIAGLLRESIKTRFCRTAKDYFSGGEAA